MIKRINNIQNVGTFRNFPNGGSIQFEKLTFIYGLNTKGKTTLTEIFSSLKENDPSLITSRKSIPTVNTNQNVRISVKGDATGNEVQCIFSNTAWTQVSLNNNLHIFGSDFIHKNLFTGLTIDRQNRENFTRFILGEEGVSLATQIAEDKRLLRQKKAALNSFLPAYLIGKQEEYFHQFFAFDIDAFNLEQEKTALSDLEGVFSHENERLERPSEILNLEEFPQIVSTSINVDNLIHRTNFLLRREYTEVSSIAIEKLQLHIERNFESKETAEVWIKEGLDTRNKETNDCSFCGQSLANASDLIDVYHTYFNEEYRKYISDISDEIFNLRSQWLEIKYDLLNTAKAKTSLLSQYSQLINTEDFTELVNRLNELFNATNEAELNDLVNQYLVQIDTALNHKYKKPHENIQQLNFENLSRNHASYLESTVAIRESIADIGEKIRLFKESYRDLTQIRSRIGTLQTEIEIKKGEIARVEQDSECTQYQNEQIEISVIESRILANELLLSTNQNEYLTNFYGRIDFHFRQFGSENFTLERGTDSRGNQPVYFLKVKFKNVEITDSNISKVFSESDKRALALSLFWAKMDFLTNEQKEIAIIILDDPITSFDDNRILKSITRIKEALSAVGQVIVLTHYSHFIRNFMERGMNDDFTISFIEIAQNNNTSFLRRTDSKNFTETTYDKIFSKIQAFINRESEIDIRNDLRPFLESQFLPHFFIKEFKIHSENDTPFNTLNEKIEAIFLDENVKAKFHEFRTMLNSDSHLFTSSNDEDVRNFAGEMMNYLYNFSHNN